MGYVWYLAFGACIAIISYAIVSVGRREAFLPPGPPTLPVLGNLHQIPVNGIEKFLRFTSWAEQYGGIFSLKLGPRTAVVLTDRRIVKQLLDKRSGLYSDRPGSFVAHELGLGGDLSLQMRYGATWQRVRRVLNEHVKEATVERQHVPLVEAEGSQLLHDMMTAPEDHMLHPRRYSNSIAFCVIWGIRSPDVRTPRMLRIFEILDDLGELLAAAARVPVDLYPALRWLPGWCFRECHRRAALLSEKQVALYNGLSAQLRARREQGGGQRGRRPETLMDRVLDRDLEARFGFTASQMYGVGVGPIEGASHTTSSVILAAVHAWTRWPEVQRRAREEIDAVVGSGRSPVWADYDGLPYVAATVKEAMRWRPAGPLAFPHALIEGKSVVVVIYPNNQLVGEKKTSNLTRIASLPDDWIDGYKIPKGTSVILNTWGLHHDGRRFPDPDRFEPERFLGVAALATKLAQAVDPEDRDHYGYGAGRRICPGMHLAERSLFVAIAKLLWAFEFAPGEGEDGEPLEADTDPVRAYGMHLIMSAKDYPLRLKVRGEAWRETIIREYETAARDVFPVYTA